MSLLWLDEFPTFDEDLSRLSSQQLRTLAARCLAHAYDKVRPDMANKIDRGQLSVVDDLVQVATHFESTQPQKDEVTKYLAILDSVFPDDTQREYSVPGWVKLLTALYECFGALRSSYPKKYVVNVMSSSYAPVADADFQKELWRARGLAGDQIVAAERRSIQGTAEIAFQRQCWNEVLDSAQSP
jgi:hypothetical protein